MPIIPIVNDQFWFEFSKKMVEIGQSKRDDAAAKLQTMIGWFWGIYTAGAAVGISLSQTSYSLPIILLIASPSIVLIAAYWVSVWVQMPVEVQFDPRIPNDIKNAYIKGINIKGRKLTAAIALSASAAILVSTALIASSLSKKVPIPNFQAFHHVKEGHDIIALSGYFPPEKKVIVRITSFPRTGSPVISKELFYVMSPSGELQSNIEFDTTSDKYEVIAEWKEEDELFRSLRRTIVRKSGKDDSEQKQ